MASPSTSVVSSHATTTNATPSNSNPASVPSLSNLPFTISVKLTASNYPIWKAQAVPYFKGQGVFGYLDGSLPIPPPEIISTDSSTGASLPVANPSYLQWHRQDSLILATINSTLTEDVLSQVMSYTTSRDVWTALERSFASVSRAKAIQIHTQLANARKGSQTASSFFISVKRMADELALAGQSLTSDEIITYILAGLGQEYDSLASTISSRSEAVSLEDFYSLLLICESRIENHHQPLPVVGSVNVAVKTSPPQHHSQFQHSFRNNAVPSSRGPGSFRGRGRGGRHPSFDNGPPSVVVCQVCFKSGHTARKCYHHFNPSYQDQQSSQPQPHAMVAAHSQSSDRDWYADTGATHHLTNDPNQIQKSTMDYGGHDHIQVANGAGLPILRSGSSSFSTPSKSFVLNQILLVPEITKNLLSV